MNNETQKVDVHGDWKVTYLNILDGQRYTLIDDVDEATADRVVARFSDKGNPYTYLPETRIERSSLARIGGES
jgi:hypothetical protein